jgi:hypothetical protein
VTWVGLVALSAAVLGGAYAALTGRAGLAAACAGAVFGIRLPLVRLGYIYSPGSVRLLDLLVAAAFLLVAVGARRRLGSPTATAEQRLALVAGILALPVASVALVQVLGPAASQQSGGLACSGSPVAGSALEARTGAFGLNARSGPGTTYAPEGRFDTNCTIGVDGYCVGEGVQDVVVPLPDVRWLRLRHSHRYVAAGTLFALGPESSLKGAPEEDCPEHQPDPVLVGPPRVSRVDKNILLISAEPVRTELVGFSLYYEQTSPMRLEQLGITPKRVDAKTGRIYARANLANIRAASPSARHVTLAVVPCLAPVVPSHTGEHLIHIELKTGRTAKVATGQAPQLERLRQAACRIDPSASNNDIKTATVSRGP